MPYIKQDKRDILDPVIDELMVALVNLEIDDPMNNMEGNINYVFTRLLKKCYGDSYAELNDALGVLSAVQLEFYRRVAVPYEDQKIYDNGDVEK
jgi:hypothetical protein